jgi:hypothetical protein
LFPDVVVAASNDDHPTPLAGLDDAGAAIAETHVLVGELPKHLAGNVSFGRRGRRCIGDIEGYVTPATLAQPKTSKVLQSWEAAFDSIVPPARLKSTSREKGVAFT